MSAKKNNGSKMKYLLVALVWLPFHLLHPHASKAQVIDTLVIIPSNPTTDDTVKVVSYTWHPNSSCPLTSSSVGFVNDTISIYAFHSQGMLPATCNSIDTLLIGQLNAGVYELRYHLIDTASPTIYDIDTIFFTVQQSTAIQPVDRSPKEISIYPNPATTEINIDIEPHTLGKYKISFYSTIGQNVKTLQECNCSTVVDIRELSDGVYFILITTETKGQFIQKIIKRTP